MPTRQVVFTDHPVQWVEQVEEARRDKNAIELLREAVQLGVADMAAGRFHSFESVDGLAQHLATLRGDALGR